MSGWKQTTRRPRTSLEIVAQYWAIVGAVLAACAALTFAYEALTQGNYAPVFPILSAMIVLFAGALYFEWLARRARRMTRISVGKHEPKDAREGDVWIRQP